MGDVGTVLGAAQTLFAALECTLLKEAISILGYESQLQDLQKTIETVKSVLLDAGAKHHDELSHSARDYVQELKDAVYDADDLFDEFLTLAESKKELSKDGKVGEKVRYFFSSKNPLKVAYSMSREVKRVAKKLDGIASNHTKFGLKVDSQPIRKRREETCLYVYAPDIVGREDDVTAIVRDLVKNREDKDVYFLAIVGVGGLGKTTLAQLVYNDEGVRDQGFLRLWVCVSDQDGKEFSVKVILSKIIESATGYKPCEDSSLDRMQVEFREELAGKKFLLVLDDVWNEDRDEWLKLSQFLMIGGKGSRVVVTTRSRETARIIGNGLPMYELQGLSEDNSWCLFEMTAFDKGMQEEQGDERPDLVEVGKKIVKRCRNVPLAIKVVGSLLYGQHISKWRTFQQSGLAEISNGENQIMSILKLSYHNLEPLLKSCFAYCALFPKNFEIDKDWLICLWMAQGYIVPLNGGQSFEEAGSEHLLILLRRCFIEAVTKDDYGDVKSFKIHDLMHDVAQEVAGNEISTTFPSTDQCWDKLRHLFYVGRYFSNTPRIRSCINFNVRLSPMETLMAKWTCLRTLGLRGLDSNGLPDSIGKLLHLRNLDLSNGNLESLPDSITKLHNLQTLCLKECGKLKELPRKFSKLLKLRHLNLSGCRGLTYMPIGIDKLTCLCVLTDFIVADESSSGRQRVGQLKDLKTLVNLKGHIEIGISKKIESTKEHHPNEVCLKDMEHLEGLRVYFPYSRNDAGEVNSDKAVMQKLQPHPNIKELEFEYYAGEEIPRWGRQGDNWATILPNLVKIELVWCEMLQHLPCLSKLRYLKLLRLFGLKNLEYMEDAEAPADKSTFFPSLQTLDLRALHKLKGWWSSNNQVRKPSFPRLSDLHIGGCSDLTSFPPCLRLEKLYLAGINKMLHIYPAGAGFSSSRPELSVTIDSMDYLKSLSTGRLTSVKIKNDDKIESFSEVEDVFKIISSSLRILDISCFPKLKSLSEGLKHLTALESLIVDSCPVLQFDKEDKGMPWMSLLHQKLNRDFSSGLKKEEQMGRTGVKFCHLR